MLTFVLLAILLKISRSGLTNFASQPSLGCTWHRILRSIARWTPVLEEWDVVIKTMMPYLAFLATNYTVCITMYITRSFRRTIKSLPAISISVAVLVIMLATICTWKFVHSRGDR